MATHDVSLRGYLFTRVRTSAEVEDLVQEVYLRMLRVPQIEAIRSPEAYLFTVARHVIQQFALKQQRRMDSDYLERHVGSPAADSGDDPALQAVAQQTLDKLQQALEQMSPKVRATFLLHRRDGLAIDDIADRLGITRPMVKKYLVKALMQLRKQLESVE